MFLNHIRDKYGKEAIVQTSSMAGVSIEALNKIIGLNRGSQTLQTREN